MKLTRITVLYGHLEGNAGEFARDPSGHLAIEEGIFRDHGLDVSWEHVQGTEERYRRLEEGSAQLSLVVGRASLQHFLTSKSTKIIGCAMNSCPYYLMVAPAINTLSDLKGNILACREAPLRNVAIAETFFERAKLQIGVDLTLQLPHGDQEAYELLVTGKVQGALLPRPFGFWAEERGFKRIADWPDIVDDPLPITIETTEKQWMKSKKGFKKFLDGHRAGIRFLKSNQEKATRMLQERFDHSAWFAKKTFEEYFVWLDERLIVEFSQLERLLAQLAPATPGGVREIASEWIAPGALSSP
jgi:ABC-type nitrate/sulfonate/bicarbonate transport system substrate-binding protein